MSNLAPSLPTAQEVVSRWLLDCEGISFESLVNNARRAITQWENASRQLGIEPKDINAADYRKLKDLERYAGTLLQFERGKYVLRTTGDE